MLSHHEQRLLKSKLLSIPFEKCTGKEAIPSNVQQTYHQYQSRIKENEPIQYVLGETDFLGRDFMVSKQVLIPRQDTEALVRYFLAKGKPSVKIVDLGTGSGIIPISLLLENENASALGVDVSEDALELAYRNAVLFGVDDRIEFRKVDILLDDFEMDSFDWIVSNPPYIKTDHLSQLEESVRDYEPMLALDGGLDGLVFYRRILELCKRGARKGSLIGLEIGFDQKDEILCLAKDYKVVECLKDISNRDRVVILEV